MRPNRLNIHLCSLLAAALLLASCQYLAHFHIPRADVSDNAALTHMDKGQDHGAQEHCSLCLQFDRLPAPPAAQVFPAAYFVHVATVEALRLERLARDFPCLWPPSRGPPHLG
jgi:hypothetical protein